MDSLYDDLPDAPVEYATEVLAKDGGLVIDEPGMSLAMVQAGKRQEKLASLKDELYQEHMKIILDVARARDVDPDAKEMPEEFRLQHGADAEKVWRLAQASWAASKDAPAFVGVSRQIVLGIIRANATEKGGPKTLNVNLVQFQAPTMKFREIEDD